MGDHERLVLVTAAAVGLSLCVGAAEAKKRPKPALCALGRFIVQGEPLLGPGGELVILKNRTVAIGSLCAARRAKLKALKKGTRVNVTFSKSGCTGIRGRVKLSALISDACRTLSGSLKAPRARAKSFAAVVTILTHPSKSGTIAITDDRKLVVMVNPDDDSISTFSTADTSRLSKIATGDEPCGVALGPDNQTAFVANRAAATVVKVTGIDTASPTVSLPTSVGSEPIGLALSPSGGKLFVAEFAEGRVSVMDTLTMTVVGTIQGLRNPRAIAVTNDGDADDDNERIIVPEFFGMPNADGEAKDTGRTGRVRIYKTSDLSPETAITFAPIDSGFPKGGVAGVPTVMTSPNQLWAVAVQGGRIYVPSVSASPEGPPRFDNNVFAVVYVGDLTSRTELRTGAGTTNLARKVVDSFTAPPARFVLGDIVDLDFIAGTSVSYVVSRAADCVQRVTWSDPTVALGSATTRQIDVLGNATLGLCQAPTGIALNPEGSRAYVNCFVSRRLGVIDLASQTLSATVPASDPPVSDSEKSIQRGKRFYFTGRGRWSNAGANGAVGGEGWSACTSCHPDGLSDGITWVFAAGPRQTVSQDGSFSHGSGAQKQRIFNWTAIFDEHHDFEGNTRGVSGGLGAITMAPSPAECASMTGGSLANETAVTVAFGLGKPAKEVADDPTVANCGNKDWDDIDNFVRTIRPPGRIRSAADASVANGRTLFESGQCAKCHGGPGWTLSRRFYVPASTTNATLGTTDFVIPPVPPFVATWSYRDGAMPRRQISPQPVIPSDATGPAEAASIGPHEIACALRNVGTFGLPGDTAATDALELKASATLPAPRAQGRGGFNIPSLHGLAVGAPYLHHGQAATLADLFNDPRWDFHTNAGNANFRAVTLAANSQNVVDLANFLSSIDAAQPEFAVPSGFEACPAVFP